MAQTAISRLRHDLRTPVNHIIGYSQLLLEDQAGTVDSATAPAAQETLTLGREIMQIIETVLPSSCNDQPETYYPELRSRLSPPSQRIQALVKSLPDDTPQLSDFQNIFQAANRLMSLVAEATAATSAAGVTPAANEEKTGAATDHVLLVDDDSTNRDVLARMLRRLNYRVSLAADGHQAVQLVDQNKYDLLLLDILMPGLSGYDVLQHVKTKALNLPVIMISALNDMESVVKCISLGAEDYFLKPFEPVLLRARISAVLDRKKCEDRLVAQQYLASLGELTAAVGHELKNPLNFIINFAATAAEAADEIADILAPGETAAVALLDDLKRDVASIRQHGARANEIIKNMLFHCQGGSAPAELTDLNSLVAQYLTFAQVSLHDAHRQFDVVVETLYDPHCEKTLCHPADLGRAILNLAGNAFDALREKKAANPDFRPQLRVKTRSIGNSVEISIWDNGDGVPEGIREKIFRPFFTTKPAGAGTGLGLSITRDIIRRHKGELLLDTEKSRFSEFKIRIPRS
jgi:two-component system, NtrC family, sensor kinase